MDSSIRFCPYCGKPLGAGARFCGACGKPVPNLAAPAEPAPAPPPGVPRVVPPPPAALNPPQPAAAQPPIQAQPQPAAAAEPVIGVIPWVTRKSGLMGLKAEYFTLVVTPRRLIFALLTNQARSQNIQRAQQEAKASGKNFFQKVQAQMSADNGAYYYQMTPDAALGENPANFFILNQQVQSARISSHDDDEGGLTTYTLDLQGDFGKLHFELGRCDERRSKDILREALGAAMHR